MKQDLVTKLIYLSKKGRVGSVFYYLLKLLGLEIPVQVEIGEGLEIAHGGFGIVIHPYTKIGNWVKIYPGVTLGRADIYRSFEQSNFQGILIEDNVILSPGCKILGKSGVLKVGRGTIIGANAVLLQSTGDGEIWAGIPATKIGEKENN